MAKDQGLKRLVARLARLNEDQFKDDFGNIDKDALAVFVLDELEREDPEIVGVLEQEAARFFVWETIREMHRRTRKDMKTEVEEAVAEVMQPTLPNLGEIERITVSIPAGVSNHEAKNLLDCALWEVQAAEDEYGKRAHAMLQHQHYLAALVTHMRRKGFKEGDTVRELYAS